MIRGKRKNVQVRLNHAWTAAAVNAVSRAAVYAASRAAVHHDAVRHDLATTPSAALPSAKTSPATTPPAAPCLVLRPLRRRELCTGYQGEAHLRGSHQAAAGANIRSGQGRDQVGSRSRLDRRPRRQTRSWPRPDDVAGEAADAVDKVAAEILAAQSVS